MAQAPLFANIAELTALNVFTFLSSCFTVVSVSFKVIVSKTEQLTCHSLTGDLSVHTALPACLAGFCGHHRSFRTFCDHRLVSRPYVRTLERMTGFLRRAAGFLGRRRCLRTCARRTWTSTAPTRWRCSPSPRRATCSEALMEPATSSSPSRSNAASPSSGERRRAVLDTAGIVTG